MRYRISEILDASHKDDALSRGFNIFILMLILLNVLAVILASVKEYEAMFSSLFHQLEVFSVAVFTVEYVLRIWTCVEIQEYKDHMGRLRFAITPLALVDLFAILPFYLPMVFPFDFRFLRVLRLLRLFAILKLAKYVKSLSLFGRVLANKKEELVITFAVALIGLVFVSSLIFYIENEAQPEVFSSIPAAMWWSIGALTRLGVGSMNPVTDLGMLFATIVAMIGLGIFALPAGILASGLIEEIKTEKDTQGCPNCGYSLKKKEA